VWQCYVERSDVLVDEATTLIESGVCGESTGLGAVRRELQTRVSTFVERLRTTGLTLDHSRQCYQLIDKVFISHSHDQFHHQQQQS